VPNGKWEERITNEQGAVYEIRVKGVLDGRWSEWFNGMTLSSDANGETTLSGPVADQAALHGLLARVRDLGVPLVSVRRRGAEPAYGGRIPPGSGLAGVEVETRPSRWSPAVRPCRAR
jgi:hypothetical protein